MIDVVLELATTRRIGPAHAGMALVDAEALFGPGRKHPALLMHPEYNGYPIKWGNLVLTKAGDRTDEVELQLDPEYPLSLPEALGSKHVGESGAVLLEDFLSALEEAGCTWEREADSGVTGQTNFELDTGVRAIFVRSRERDDVPVRGDYLRMLYHHL